MLSFIQNNLSKFILIGGSILALITFYLFSRFTVDDAFITWRYGINFVDHGFWSYNPVGYDITQSYTNALIAFLSLVPAFFELDVVFFFKLLSVIFVFAFSFFLIRESNFKTSSIILLILFFCFPITIIHLFSGLETFYFVALMGLLFIHIDKQNYKISTILVIILMLLRPEAWTLALLFPLYYFISFKEKNSNNQTPSSDFIFVISVPIFLLIYLFMNYLYFDYFLPNSFYIKSSNIFSFFNFIFFSYHLLPILIFIFLKKIKLSLLMTTFFIIIIFQYSGSELIMNYANRFSFHIIAPIYIYAIFITSKDSGNIIIEAKDIFLNKYSFKLSYVFAVICFLHAASLFLTSRAELVHLANYYPRAQFSHSEFGNVLKNLKNENKIKSFSISDAGMAAYYSGIPNLDTIGLGSSLVAHSSGVSEEVIEVYRPDIIAFRTNANHEVKEIERYKFLMEYVESEKLYPICNIYTSMNYSVYIYSKIKAAEISQHCENSKNFNYVSDRDFFFTHNLKPPWAFWNE